MPAGLSSEHRPAADHPRPDLAVLRAGSFLAAMALLGCTSLRSSREDVGGPSYASGNQARVGMYYFLPKAFLVLEGKPAGDDGKGLFLVTTTRVLRADRRHRYFLRWTQNPFYDDKSNGIEVDDQGLLSTVDFSATDRSLEALNDVAASAINVFKIAGALESAPAAAPNAPRLQPFRFEFDPLDAAEVAVVRARLRKTLGLDLQVGAASGTQSAVGAALAALNAGKGSPLPAADPHLDDPRSGGVFYHPPLTVELRFDFRDAAPVIQRDVVSVPDPQRVACFRFGRSPFGKRDTTLTLKDGIPSKIVFERPSTIKGLTGGVSTITDTVANAVPTLINVRVNQQTENQKAQQNLLDARKDLLDKQAALQAARPRKNAAGGGDTESAPNDRGVNAPAAPPSLPGNPGPEATQLQSDLQAAQLKKDKAQLELDQLELDEKIRAKKEPPPAGDDPPKVP